MAQGPNGQIWVDLGSDGLRLYNPTTSSYPGYGQIQGFAVGDDGNVYYMQSGVLYNGTLAAAGQSGYVHGNVYHMAQGPNGQIWVDLGPDGLRLYDLATSSYPGYGIIQGFATDNNGNVYYLQNGNLYSSVSSQPIATAVCQFVVDGSGSVVALEAGGTPVQFTPGSTVAQPMYLWQPGLGQGPPGIIGVALPTGNWAPAPSISSMAVDGAGSVVALGTDGSLIRFAPGSTQGHTVSTGVQSFVIGSDGKAYFLQSNGNFWHEGSGLLGGSVRSYAFGSDGKAYFLDANGGLWHEGAGLVATSVQSFTIGGDGKAYFLQNGTLYHDGDPAVAFPDVVSFAIGGDGLPYFLQSTGAFFHQGAPSAITTSGVTSFAIGGDGKAYFLQNGTLYHDGDPAVAFGPGVTAFAIGGDGKPYFLVADGQGTGTLYHQGAPSNIATDVRSFAIAGDGKAYFLQANGYLWDDGAPSPVASGVTSMAIAGNGDVIMFDQPAGAVFEHRPGATGPDPQIGSGVTSIAIAGNGDVITLTTANTVNDHIPGGTGPDQVIGSDVKFFTIGSNGHVLMLNNAGDLYDQWNTRVPGASNLVEHAVDMFVPDNHGGLYVLQSGRLYYGPEGTSVYQTETNRVHGPVADGALDGNVLEIAPDGHGGLYVLFSGNDLYDITYVNGHRASWPGTLVTSDSVQDFYFDDAGNLHWDQTPGFWQEIGDFFANIGKDLAAFALAESGAAFLGPVGVVGMGDTVGQAVFGNQFWQEAEAGGIMAAATAISIGTAGALAPEGASLIATIEAGAVGGAAGSTFSAAANSIVFHTSFDWQSIAVGALEGAAGGALKFLLAGGSGSVSSGPDAYGRVYLMSPDEIASQLNASQFWVDQAFSPEAQVVAIVADAGSGSPGLCMGSLLVSLPTVGWGLVLGSEYFALQGALLGSQIAGASGAFWGGLAGSVVGGVGGAAAGCAVNPACFYFLIYCLR
jgi:hypothetical protein